MNSDSSDEKSYRLTTTFLLLTTFLFSGCDLSLLSRFVARTVESESIPIQTVQSRIPDPVLPDVSLSVLWIGHASVLIQIHDKVFLTDPVFTNTVGMLSRRLVESGVDPSSLRRVDYILISHTHFDHLNYSSLATLPKEARLIIPEGGAGFTPDFGFRETRELKPWDSVGDEGVRIVAVPAHHFSGRYGFDISWNSGRGYTGYIIQYRGKTIYFAGDTGYRDSLFAHIGQRFEIDVALLPIAPLEPRAFMSRVHLDPQHALQAFQELRAKLMIPIHFRTFPLGLENPVTAAQSELDSLVNKLGIKQSVRILDIGERLVLD